MVGEEIVGLGSESNFELCFLCAKVACAVAQGSGSLAKFNGSQLLHNILTPCLDTRSFFRF